MSAKQTSHFISYCRLEIFIECENLKDKHRNENHSKQAQNPSDIFGNSVSYVHSKVEVNARDIFLKIIQSGMD